MKRNPAILSPALTDPVAMAARRIFVAVLLASALGMTGCAGFEREWRRSVAGVPEVQPAAPQTKVPAHLGAWEGIWTSQGTGHTGKLRCLVDGPVAGERVAAPPAGTAAGTAAQAAFKYHATWSVFSGTFRTRQPYEARGDGSVRSAGSWTLPRWAGGRYEYDIHIEGDRFTGTWTGGGDSGAFELRRVAGGGPGGRLSLHPGMGTTDHTNITKSKGVP